MIDFKRHRFPVIIIIRAVRWYLRYKLSLSDTTELLMEGGVNVSRETIREWVLKFGPQIAKCMDKKCSRIGKRWHVDETYVKVGRCLEICLLRGCRKHGTHRHLCFRTSR